MSPARQDKNADLLPPIAHSRMVSLHVAEAVGRQAIAEGIAGVESERAFLDELRAYVWNPVYLPYERLED